MNRWTRHRGDVNDIVKVGATGVGAVAGVNDLSTVTAVEGHVQYGTGTPVVLSAAVTDAATSEVTVQLGGLAGWLSAATIGCWKFTLHITFAGGVGPVTWPGEWAFDEIEVLPAV